MRSLQTNNQNELEDAVIMRIQALFIKENRLGIRNHWLFRQELMTRDFGTNQGLKSVDTLCVFQRFQAAQLG